MALKDTLAKLQQEAEEKAQWDANKPNFIKDAPTNLVAHPA